MVNPALENAYRNLRGQDCVLFIDETYNAPDEGLDHTFYTVCGVLIERQYFEETRLSIAEIVGGNYWHTTDELRTEEGRKTAVELLEFCSEVDDLYFIAHRTPLESGTNVEEARKASLRSLLSHVGENHQNTKVIVLEKRRYNSQNNADHSLIAQLRKQKVIPRNTQAILVSPRDELLLWLPDLVAMAYRRQITHRDETASYFSRYVENSTTILRA